MILLYKSEKKCANNSRNILMTLADVYINTINTIKTCFSCGLTLRHIGLKNNSNCIYKYSKFNRAQRSH